MSRLQIGFGRSGMTTGPVPAYHWLRNLTCSLVRKPRDSIQITFLLVACGARSDGCFGGVTGERSAVVDNLRSAFLWRESGWRLERHRCNSGRDRRLRTAWRGHRAAERGHLAERAHRPEEQHHISNSTRVRPCSGRPDHQDYPAKTEFRVPGLQSLVSATEATNVSITGEGVIDGAGESWWQEARGVGEHGVMGSDHTATAAGRFRPLPARAGRGRDDPEFAHVAARSLLLRRRDDSERQGPGARNIRPIPTPSIRSPPLTSSSITFTRTWATTTSPSNPARRTPPGPDDPSRDITITDCTFLHGHGLSVGSEIAGGAQNIRAERIHFDGTDNGIRIKANRDRGNDVECAYLPRHRYEERQERHHHQRVLPEDPAARSRSAAAGHPADASFPQHHPGKRDSHEYCFSRSHRRTARGADSRCRF